MKSKKSKKVSGLYATIIKTKNNKRTIKLGKSKNIYDDIGIYKTSNDNYIVYGILPMSADKIDDIKNKLNKSLQDTNIKYTRESYTVSKSDSKAFDAILFSEFKFIKISMAYDKFRIYFAQKFKNKKAYSSLFDANKLFVRNLRYPIYTGTIGVTSGMIRYGFFKKYKKNREVNMDRVDKIVDYQLARYKSDNVFSFYGALTLVYRLGGFYIIDGQHRLAAIDKLLSLGYGDCRTSLSISVVLDIHFIPSKLDSDGITFDIFTILNNNKELAEIYKVNTKSNFILEVESYFKDNYLASIRDQRVNKSRPKIDLVKILSILTKLCSSEKLAISSKEFIDRLLIYEKKMKDTSFENINKFISGRRATKNQYNKCESNDSYLFVGLHNDESFWINEILADCFI